jgi:hypothetical protein
VLAILEIALLVRRQRLPESGGGAFAEFRRRSQRKKPKMIATLQPWARFVNGPNV